jgi:hypothetical protein
MTTKTGITHAELKTKRRAVREGFPQTMSLRVHRAISWIGRAEACGADADARFIFLWIAFNAAYAQACRRWHGTLRNIFHRLLARRPAPPKSDWRR